MSETCRVIDVSEVVRVPVREGAGADATSGARWFSVTSGLQSSAVVV